MRCYQSIPPWAAGIPIHVHFGRKSEWLAGCSGRPPESAWWRRPRPRPRGRRAVTRPTRAFPTPPSSFAKRPQKLRSLFKWDIVGLRVRNSKQHLPLDVQKVYDFPSKLTETERNPKFSMYCIFCNASILFCFILLLFFYLTFILFHFIKSYFFSFYLF